MIDRTLIGETIERVRASCVTPEDEFRFGVAMGALLPFLYERVEVGQAGRKPIMRSRETSNDAWRENLADIQDLEGFIALATTQSSSIERALSLGPALMALEHGNSRFIMYKDPRQFCHNTDLEPVTPFMLGKAAFACVENGRETLLPLAKTQSAAMVIASAKCNADGTRPENDRLNMHGYFLPSSPLQDALHPLTAEQVEQFKSADIIGASLLRSATEHSASQGR